MHINTHTAVLGLGNPILCDDAVGLRVAEELERLLSADPIPGVVVMQSTRAGFELIDMLSGFHHAVIVDCLQVPEPVPGRIRELSLADFSGSARLNSAHEVNITTAFTLARQMGAPMPQTVEIYAIEAGDTATFTENLTPQVAAVVGPLAQQLLSSLSRAAVSDCRPVDGSAPQPQVFYPPE